MWPKKGYFFPDLPALWLRFCLFFTTKGSRFGRDRMQTVAYHINAMHLHCPSTLTSLQRPCPDPVQSATTTTTKTTGSSAKKSCNEKPNQIKAASSFEQAFALLCLLERAIVRQKPHSSNEHCLQHDNFVKMTQ